MRCCAQFGGSRGDSCGKKWMKQTDRRSPDIWVQATVCLTDEKFLFCDEIVTGNELVDVIAQGGD